MNLTERTNIPQKYLPQQEVYKCGKGLCTWSQV